jgi:2-polyprenyl-3-methyl-5-hydroxy-6-metoxy-1,4-benzoquinol methylase
VRGVPAEIRNPPDYLIAKYTAWAEAYKKGARRKNRRIAERHLLQKQQGRQEDAMSSTGSGTTARSKDAAAMPCPVCGADSRFASGFSDIHLFRCPDCRHCFTDLNALEKVEQYGPEYFQETHRNWFEHPDERLFERIRRVIAELCPGAAVLDVGCGNGNLLRYLRAKDSALRLTGIDYAPNPPAKGIEYLCGDFMTWNTGRKFDVVTSLQVIEHVPNPMAFAARLAELCKAGGLVITSTINEQSILYDAARTVRGMGSRLAFERLYGRHHLNHFNISSLRRLMENSGLKLRAHLRHNAPLKAMDIPAPNRAAEKLLRAGVWGVFALGKLTGRTTYQTIVCQK